MNNKINKLYYEHLIFFHLKIYIVILQSLKSYYNFIYFNLYTYI